MRSNSIKPTVHVCENCNIEFLFRDYPSAIKLGRGRFCSKKCQAKNQAIPLIDRFFVYVGRKCSNGCIPWIGCKNKDGYGVIGSECRPARMILANRASYELFVGKIPEAFKVLHSCDNPSCINPIHLFSGTQADNIHDMVAKGRARKRVPGSRRWLREQKAPLATS